jgi:hypothetical protein
MSNSKRRIKKCQTKKNHKLKKKYGGNFNDIKNQLELNLQSKQLKLAKMLNVVCKNPDNCLAIGYYGDIIKMFFDDFKNFSYVKINQIKRIGKQSVNGFVLEIPFKKDRFKAYTVLKCSANPRSDNLFYEYYVGKYFINTYIKKLPCFVETYDCYEIKDESAWNSLYNNSLYNIFYSTNFSNILKLKQTKNTDYHEFGESCLKNKLLCILIQHFDKFYSFGDEYFENFENIKYEIVNILYQVYYPLVCLGNKYTHYDLHFNNVFLYKPYEGKQYIKMRYHRNGEVYEFPSEYIVKIIDYGRNYFNNNNTDTQQLLDKYICPSKKCDPNCGRDMGYAVIQGDLRSMKIEPGHSNMSYDLNFAYTLKPYLDKLNIYNDFIYNNTFGSAETINYSYKKNKIVYSIYDLLVSVESYMKYNSDINLVQKYDNSWSCVATMDIYDDGRDYTFNILSSPINEKKNKVKNVIKSLWNRTKKNNI